MDGISIILQPMILTNISCLKRYKNTFYSLFIFKMESQTKSEATGEITFPQYLIDKKLYVDYQTLALITGCKNKTEMFRWLEKLGEEKFPFILYVLRFYDFIFKNCYVQQNLITSVIKICFDYIYFYESQKLVLKINLFTTKCS